MPSASYNDYARAILALPGTAADIAAKLGMTQRGLTTMFRRLWALKLVHPGGMIPAAMQQPAVSVWKAGDGERAEGLRVTRMRPRANHIAFASAWRALEDGATAHGLAAETGLSHVSVYRLLAALKGHVRITGWEHDAMGRPVAVWTLGAGTSLRKPKGLLPGDKHRRYRKRLQAKAMQFLPGAAAAVARLDVRTSP